MSDRWRDESDYRILLQSAISGKAEYLASKTGRSVSYWYKIAEGQIALIPDDIPVLVNALEDTRLISWLLDRCKGLSLTTTGAKRLNGSICDEIEDLTVALGNLVERKRAAYADGRVDTVEKQKLLDAANELYAIAAQLLEETKHIDTKRA